MVKQLIVLGTVLLLGLGILGCPQQVSEGITEEEAKALLDRVLLSYNEGNFDLIDETMVPEYVVHHSALPEERQFLYPGHDVAELLHYLSGSGLSLGFGSTRTVGIRVGSSLILMFD